LKNFRVNPKKVKEPNTGERKETFTVNRLRRILSNRKRKAK